MARPKKKPEDKIDNYKDSTTMIRVSKDTRDKLDTLEGSRDAAIQSLLATPLTDNADKFDYYKRLFIKTLAVTIEGEAYGNDYLFDFTTPEDAELLRKELQEYYLGEFEYKFEDSMDYEIKGTDFREVADSYYSIIEEHENLESTEEQELTMRSLKATLSLYGVDVIAAAIGLKPQTLEKLTKKYDYNSTGYEKVKKWVISEIQHTPRQL